MGVPFTELIYSLRVRLARAYIGAATAVGLTFFPLFKVDGLGIDFYYQGDYVVWTWPRLRAGRGKWVSLLWSGNGEWGDAWYPTLRAISDDWAAYERAEVEAQLRQAETDAGHHLVVTFPEAPQS